MNLDRPWRTSTLDSCAITTAAAVRRSIVQEEGSQTELHVGIIIYGAQKNADVFVCLFRFSLSYPHRR